MSGKSGTICSVYCCKNYSWQKDARSFFRFPKDRNRCAAWVNNCKTNHLEQMFKTYGSEYLYQSHRICSDHFQLSDFNNRNLKSQGLKKTAIPSLNLSVPSSKNVGPSIKKKLRRSPKKRTRLCIGEADRVVPMADINDDFPPSEMVGCAAYGCSNRSEKGYLMKRFPRDPARRKIWADRVRRKGWTPTHCSVLCEVHFEPSMWEKTRVDGTRKLKWDAVPTVFPFSPIKKRRKSPVERASKLLTNPDDMVQTSSNSSICTEAKNVMEVWPSEASETQLFCTINEMNGINIKMENSEDTLAFPAVQREEKMDAGEEDSAQGNVSEELYEQSEVHIKVERDLEAVMSTPVKIEIKEECWGESELPQFFEESRVDVKVEEFQEPEVLPSPNNVAEGINHHIGGSAVQYSATSEDESGKTCSAEMLSENKRKKRRKIKVDSPEEQDHPYTCGTCKKSFLNVGSLGRHEQMHVSKPPYSYICHFCTKSFRQASVLSCHLRVHTRERLFSCDICHKSFKQPSGLKSHARVHTNDRPFRCDVCNKCFAYSNALNEHTRVHTGERPYSCQFCTKTFTQLSILIAHEGIHTGIRPYNCAICKKAFSSASDLTKHIRVHSGERPYSCDYCNSSFTQSGALTRHVRSHTGERPYSCEICGKSYKDSCNLASHVKRLHSANFPRFT